MSNAVRDVFNDYTKGSNILDAIIENVNLYKKTMPFLFKKCWLLFYDMLKLIFTERNWD